MNETSPVPLPMARILESVRQAVGASHLEGKVRERSRFCPVDGKRIPPDDPIRCPACGYQGHRALTFDPALRFEIEGPRLRHYSAGAVVVCRFRHEPEDRVLLLRRTTHPVGAWTIPAGHYDVGDTTPLLAAQREVAEETGLRTERGRWSPLSQGELLHEGCRRGADEHVWHCYRLDCEPVDAEPRLPAGAAEAGGIGEADAVAWARVADVAAAGRFLLTSPAAHFFARVFGVAPANALDG